MDYLTVLASDPEFFKVAFAGAFIFLVFGEWKFASAWVVMYFFLYGQTEIEWIWPLVILVGIYCLVAMTKLLADLQKSVGGSK